jgi:ABC-type uncharacterized transport system auxiliary subunit
MNYLLTNIAQVSKMRKILILSCIVTLAACGGDNTVETPKTTYISCQINSSHATIVMDRENDLLQCWSAEGSGYESQVYAVQWCEEQVNTYINTQYLEPHTVTYSVASTDCASE